MAKLDEKRLSAVLEDFLPRDEVEEMARKTGAVVRRRKIDVVALVWTLVLGFAASGERRTLASLRRAYQAATGTAIEESSFYDRFNAGLVTLMKTCVQRALKTAREAQGNLTGALAQFQDVLIADSTVVRLRDKLRILFPGARKNHSPAALKVHTVLSAVAEGPTVVRVSPGTAADVKALIVGDEVRDKLLLFDLGYFSYVVFGRIARQGGYFISRLKDNANPTIKFSNLMQRGWKHPVEGRPLRQVLNRLKRNVADFTVSVTYKSRVYRGQRRSCTASYRVVGVRNASTGSFHLYLTNIPAECLSAEECAQIYRLRWETELFYKEGKTSFHLEDVATSNQNVLLCLVYASILTTILARQLRGAVKAHLPKRKRRLPPRRFARVLATVSLLLLQIHLGNASPSTVRHTLATLTFEAVDPNRRRVPIMAALEIEKQSRQAA